MSLLGRLSSIIPMADESDTDARDPRSVEAFLLVYDDPAAPCGASGLGWTLTAWRGAELRWSEALDAHGAGPQAEARVAKAVAVRMLIDRDVQVADWSEDIVGMPRVLRAVVRS